MSVGSDYMLREETAATLKGAGELVSDDSLTAIVLKRFPPEFKPFVTVVTQGEKAMTFSEFKFALRSFEATEKCQSEPISGDDVMAVRAKAANSSTNLKCDACGRPGHKAVKCRATKRWCEICQNTSHPTKWCRKNKTHSKSVQQPEIKDSHAYIFKVC